MKVTPRVKSWKHLTLEYLQVELTGRDLFLNYVNTNHVSEKRVKSLLVKEPTTIAWLDSFEPEDFFVDVGANVGMYTVYAAVTRGCQVAAFEPEALNYAELNKNLFLNGLHKQVRAYCAGISDENKLTDLYLSDFIPGYSHHDCGENRWEGPVTKLARSQEARLPQGCIAFTLDYLFPGVRMPDHVKIDVDGLELNVLRGGHRLLERRTGGPKSVLVEVDLRLPMAGTIFNRMRDLGWIFSLDQVTTFRDKKVTPEEWNRWVAEGKGGCNVIYFREESRDLYNDLFARFKESWLS